MRIIKQIGKWDIDFSNRARHNWFHFKIHRNDLGKHIVWGKLSLSIEDGTLECIPICAQCGSCEIGEQGYGDESWTVCSDCRSIEQGYKYISQREWNERFG